MPKGTNWAETMSNSEKIKHVALRLRVTAYRGTRKWDVRTKKVAFHSM